MLYIRVIYFIIINEVLLRYILIAILIIILKSLIIYHEAINFEPELSKFNLNFFIN